jgi:Spy/CpxP family protein refolding chaperone
MRRHLLNLAVTGALTAFAPTASAQPGSLPDRRPRPGVERVAAAVQRHLGLTDEQAARLRVATRRFAAERDRLNREERAARIELRAAVAGRDSVNQQRVAQLLDELLRIRRRRVETLAAEQQELARFLTPVQRARFLALQERAMRAAQQARARRPTRAGADGVPPGGA